MSKKHHSLIVKFAAFTSEMRTCECPNIGQISTFWNHSKVSIFTIKSNFGKSKHGISQSVQLLSCVRLFVTPWTAARQTSLSSPNPRVYSNSCPSSQWCHPSNHLILCHPLFLPPSILPSIRVFSNESVLCIRCQSIGVSALASVPPMNIQDWSPLELTSLISLLSKGLSRVFSNTTVQKYQFFGAQLSL